MTELPPPPSLSPATLGEVYARLRPALAEHPLLEAQEGYDLGALDQRVARFDGDLERFWALLHGPEQLRFAGLLLLQAALPEQPAVTVEAGLVVTRPFALVAGDLSVQGNLRVGDGTALVVLGRLAIAGNLLGGTVDYSMVAAGRLELRSGVTVGELLATEAIVAAERLYLADNSYSCRAPRLEARVLVDYERTNRIGTVVAQERVSKWDVDAAARALGFDPEPGQLLRRFREELARA